LDFPNIKYLRLKGNPLSHIELGKVRLNPSLEFYISIFKITGDAQLTKGNLPFFYDIKSLYMKLEATNFIDSMFQQWFLFEEEAQVFRYNFF
jgi:hypothetical protein